MYVILKILLKWEKNNKIWWIMICYEYEIFSLSSFTLLTVVARNDIERYYPHAVMATIIYGGKNDREISLDPFFLYLFQEADVTRD